MPRNEICTRIPVVIEAACATATADVEIDIDKSSENFGENNTFKTAATTVLNFDENNPFGEIQ